MNTSSQQGGRGADALGRLLTRAGLRAALPYVALALAVILAAAVVGREIDEHLRALEAWIAGLGAWGELAFVGLFVLTTSLLVPDTLLCLAAGALFGLGWGALAVLAGSLTASALQFALARRLLRARIERALRNRPSLAAIQRAVRQDELRLQLLLRLTPLNPATISYLLGAAGVHFGRFLLACLALAPNLLIAVYVGHAGEHVAELAGGAPGADRLQELATLGGAAVGLVVLVLVSRAARKALRQAVDEPAGTAGAEGA